MALQDIFDFEHLESQIKDIQYLDELLQEKQVQEKKALKDRLAEEESVCKSLKELATAEQCEELHPFSDAVKKNAQHFLSLVQTGTTERAARGAKELEAVSEDMSADKTISDKLTSMVSVAKIATFVVRNKQLAKCGQGILSLTDEDKLRLNEILSRDNEESCQDVATMYHLPSRLQSINHELEKFVTGKPPGVDNDNEKPWQRSMKHRLRKLSQLNARLSSTDTQNLPAEEVTESSTTPIVNPNNDTEFST